ncbi:ribonuclease HIII [Candidatus Margulisiibacteriota bacterium]
MEKSSWIGTDEAGKGDYFGPLVIAGVMVTPSLAEDLHKEGIKESKRTTDNKVRIQAKLLMEKCINSIVTINPKKYNELITKMPNLNHLLAWGHARVIENILERTDCPFAVSDQFGNKSYIENALMKKGKTVHLEQRHKAEDDIAVAAASILARSQFLNRLSWLSKDFGIELPKGASDKVIEVGKKFVEKFGESRLQEVAKVHFKTTGKIVTKL